MPTERPPTIDPAAAARWEQLPPSGGEAPREAPWLHEEVARRMHDRLQWIKLAPAAWADWDPLRGGMEGHGLVAAQYPDAACFVAAPQAGRGQAAIEMLAKPWWRRWGAPAVSGAALQDGGVQMLWANMALHMAADPQALMARWHRALATGGFLMFSALGPDTLRELRGLYAALGWPPPAHEFTDMHDWGDMLVGAGFAEPVMDMGHITLTYETPQRLLAELRTLGRNLHQARFAGLRGRAFRARLEAALSERLRPADGRLALTFEIVYGHALKPLARARVEASSSLSLADMRSLLQADRRTRE